MRSLNAFYAQLQLQLGNPELVEQAADRGDGPSSLLDRLDRLGVPEWELKTSGE